MNQPTATLKNSVFYSLNKRDPHSRRLVKAIKQMPFGDQFTYVCIDPDPVTKQVNNDLLFILNITKVPTVYVHGTRLEGSEAVEWLQAEMEDLYGEQEYPPQYRPSPAQQRQQPSQSGPFQSAGRRVEPDMQMPSAGFIGGPGVGGIGPRRPAMHPGGQGAMPMMPTMPGDARPPFDGNPNVSGGNGSGLGGASFDSSFADPFSPTAITGQTSVTPIETKTSDHAPRMDMALARYEQERDAAVYVPPRPNY